MICKTGDTSTMTTQYDELGNVIGDDGSYPMEHIMAHAPARPMPLQANGSDVPYVASEIPQTPPPVQQPAPTPAPQTPPPSQSFLERMTLPIQAAMTHMPGAAFVQGITPAIQFPFQVAGVRLMGLQTKQSIPTPPTLMQTRPSSWRTPPCRRSPKPVKSTAICLVK